jgi:predicted ABC-type transport system involved in lysophospholipase L1 biosynthesis ATPase subunit
VLITHDESIAQQADRIVRMRSGRVESDSPVASLQRSA